MVTISSGVVKTMIPEVNLSKISSQRMTYVLWMISLTLIILQVQSLLHLLIFPSVIHHCFLTIIGLYVQTNTIVITSLSSLNRTLFPLRITIQSGNKIEPNTLCTGKLVPDNFKESSDPIADFTSSLIEISKECIPQTSTDPTKSNPWYNDDCKEAIQQRKQALSKFKRSPNTNNFNNIKVFRAKARTTIKISKRKSLRSYVSKINHKTPIKRFGIW